MYLTLCLAAKTVKEQALSKYKKTANLKLRLMKMAKSKDHWANSSAEEFN